LRAARRCLLHAAFDTIACCTSCHDCTIARRVAHAALPALPPQDNLMVKDRGPFLFWMLNERAPAVAAAR
jgi:hypothetical protein